MVYPPARKGIKSQIVDQLVAATGYGRKHAITLLNNPPSSIRGSDSNGAKSHVTGRSWDRLASQDLSPSVSQGTIWRYVAVDGRLGYA